MKIKKVDDFTERNRREMSMADLEDVQAQALMTAMLTDTLIIPDEGEGTDGPGLYEED